MKKYLNHRIHSQTDPCYYHKLCKHVFSHSSFPSRTRGKTSSNRFGLSTIANSHLVFHQVAGELGSHSSTWNGFSGDFAEAVKGLPVLFVLVFVGRWWWTSNNRIQSVVVEVNETFYISTNLIVVLRAWAGLHSESKSKSKACQMGREEGGQLFFESMAWVILVLWDLFDRWGEEHSWKQNNRGSLQRHICRGKMRKACLHIPASTLTSYYIFHTILYVFCSFSHSLLLGFLLSHHRSSVFSKLGLRQRVTPSWVALKMLPKRFTTRVLERNLAFSPCFWSPNLRVSDGFENFRKSMIKYYWIYLNRLNGYHMLSFCI